ncbi:MAG: ribosomal protein S18-alanine N-acetyltransferase [Clostridium sp.]|nr:ribosomal protein S18-alanine N-acetyltransferase [Clostridium sp.]
MNIKIIKAKKENTADIFRIEQACFATPWTERSISDSIENDSNYFNIAYADGQPAGYMSMQLAAGEGDIMRVAVLPSYRRLGIGKALLDTCFSSNPLDAVFLDVREHNTPAIRLYEFFGFERVGLRKNYYTNPTENAVIMTKKMKEQSE